MKPGIQVVLTALDSAATAVDFFVRNDDAGWNDARLWGLLECTGRAGVPIDLAVIPQACSIALANDLSARLDAAPHLISLHQHGYAHTNHENTGRKCEFGGARGMNQQRDDLLAGRQRLGDLFGTRVEKIFTPPWNRCHSETPVLLAELGYSALSRDRSAPAQTALPELAVDLDWSKQLHQAAQHDEDAAYRIGSELARHININASQSVGIMLHHADMDAHDLQTLEAFLTALARHPRAQWKLMRDLSCVATSRTAASVA